ncbi:hypothetical protein [Aquibacillus saliphilus]|uniref:hypothetical protein n=1 Tax=Aquibacillus saliphilus TaxID=1909422 RepID=UPI001CF017B3|nr:hypothetical protein [Aquibacillus saliphilus]
MKLIYELLEELTEVASDYNKDLIDKIELDLKLQLLMSKVDKIEINFYVSPLQKLVNKRHTNLFNQLLFKSKYNAKQSLIRLKEANNKCAFNTKLGLILANNLNFNYLYEILENSCRAYISRNHVKHEHVPIQLFIYSKMVDR